MPEELCARLEREREFFFWFFAKQNAPPSSSYSRSTTKRKGNTRPPSDTNESAGLRLFFSISIYLSSTISFTITSFSQKTRFQSALFSFIHRTISIK